MSDRIKISSEINPTENMLPRTIFSEYGSTDRSDKVGDTNAIVGLNGLLGTPGMNVGGPSIMRNPSRRFYDPEVTTTSIYLPRDLKTKNRWNRWFYAHDELVGTVLELHAELPYSQAEIVLDDFAIKRRFEDCFDDIKLFSMLTSIDLEYLKIGEIFINTPWDSSKGQWSHIIPLNPDYIDVKFSPFADQEAVIELIPDDELKKIVHSTKPEEQQLKKKIPQDILRRVLSGKNIVMDSDEVTHIARKLNPYDTRGTSIISRLYRTLMYEDKLREAQITIADNFVYPLKIFKLGDPNKGWIPNQQHQQALAQMLQQATFDPNFSLIYHYGLSVDYVTVADKVMRLEKEWSDINAKKMVALGVSQQFLNGESSYSSASVGLQMQLARYKAKRDLFEIRWIQDKLFRVMAERNEWYKRDKKEIAGQYRISRNEIEKRDRLMIPKLSWHKKLMLRDDQAFLTFLNNVYAQGKGPLSALSLLEAMGMSLEEELRKKKSQKEYEQKIGEFVQPPAPGAPAPGAMPAPMGAPAGAPPPPPPTGAKAFLKNIFVKQAATKQTIVDPIVSASESEIVPMTVSVSDSDLTGVATDTKYAKDTYSLMSNENKDAYQVFISTEPTPDKVWLQNITASETPLEISDSLQKIHLKLASFHKKYDDDSAAFENEKEFFTKAYQDLFVQGKLASYDVTNFLTIYNQYYAQDNTLKDFADIVLCNEFSEWYDTISKAPISFTKKASKIRNIGITVFSLGQLKGYQEQGINNIRLSNVITHDGLHYKIPDLQKHAYNLDLYIGSNGEVPLFTPCIEGYDDEEFGNNVDPQIRRYLDFICNDISVKQCPIEYSKNVRRVLNASKKYIKSKYSTIVFVRDIVDTQAWEAQQHKIYEKEFGADDNAKIIINERVAFDKTQKRAKISTLIDDHTLYISNWVGMDELPLTTSLLNALNMFNDEGLIKKVAKVYKQQSYDLTQDELDTYRVFNYIEPVLDTNQLCRGYKVSFKTASTLPAKLKIGGAWSAEGKCLSDIKHSGNDIFFNNIRIWIDYPSKVDESIKYLYEEVL